MKKNTKKSTNPIAKEEKYKKVVFDEYRNMNTFRIYPVTVEYIEQVALELIEWAKDDCRALKISQFFTRQGISTTTVKKWRDKSPVFDEAYVYAKQIIGDRRETGAIENEYDSGMIRSSMPIYDDEWKMNEEWRSKLKDQSGQMGNVKVVIEQCPSSDKVPSRDDEE